MKGGQNKMDEVTIANKRRQWVNENFGKLNRGKNLSNKKKTKLFKNLWRRARKLYK